MDSFEASGQWWLPEKPDHKVAGTLTVSESGRSELRLIGSLRSMEERGETSTTDGVTTTIFTEKAMQASWRLSADLRLGRVESLYFR